jgi:hypothetical protein
MKRIVLFIAVVLMAKFAVAQTDTLFSGKKAIPCKIVEISESEFKYKKAELMDGPTYVIDRSKVTKYTLAGGFSEIVVPDEMSVEHEHKEILGNRSVIKIQPFSLALNYISIGYEKVIRVGTNLDIEAGYMNNAMTTNSNFYGYGINSYNGTPFTYGFYFKPGVKFFLGQDFSVKGLKYAHPLKGRYIKLDLAVSYLNIQNVGYYQYNYNNPYPYYYNSGTLVSTDINSIAAGGFINYGRQFILGNVLTLDYYVGFGYTFQTNSYTNSSYMSTQNVYFRGEANSIYRYGAFVRIPGVGISGTAGLRIGYIIPSKKAAALPKKANATPIKN